MPVLRTRVLYGAARNGTFGGLRGTNILSKMRRLSDFELFHFFNFQHFRLRGFNRF